jgi:hypothetical protein
LITDGDRFWPARTRILVVRVGQINGHEHPIAVSLKNPQKKCHSEARDCRARNLLLRSWQQADSSPIDLALE